MNVRNVLLTLTLRWQLDAFILSHQIAHFNYDLFNENQCLYGKEIKKGKTICSSNQFANRFTVRASKISHFDLFSFAFVDALFYWCTLLEWKPNDLYQVYFQNNQHNKRTKIHTQTQQLAIGMRHWFNCNSPNTRIINELFSILIICTFNELNRSNFLLDLLNSHFFHWPTMKKSKRAKRSFPICRIHSLIR